MGVHQALKPEETSKALNKKYVVDDRITVLEELDSAMEVFLNEPGWGEVAVSSIWAAAGDRVRLPRG